MDGPPTFTGFIRDISERRRAEEAQKAHYAELQTVYELSQKVLNTLDLEKILQEFLNNALSIGAFDIGVIRLFEPTERSFRVAASKGYRDNDNIKHLTIGLSQEGIGVNLGQVILDRHIGECPGIGGLGLFQKRRRAICDYVSDQD